MNNPQLFLNGRCDRLVLKILSKIHVATKKQLTGFLTLADPEQGEEASDNCFKKLIDLDLLAVKRCRITSGLGEIRTRVGCPAVPIDVYYLSNEGVQCAEIAYPSIGRFARAGEPTGVHEARIYHDLLIAEAFLLACSVYDVTNFFTEAELKSEIFHSRNGYKVAENTGDFRIHYIRHDGVADSFVGEVILQSKREQLAGKPNNIVYYTDCQQTADRVQEFKGTGSFILKNVLKFSKENDQKTEQNSAKTAQNFTNLEKKILELFDKFSIGIDAKTVGILLKIHRANASSALYDLVKKNAITYQFLRINDGRPVKLYGGKNVRLFNDFFTRKLYYSCCLLLRLIVKTNSAIEEFNVENSTVIIKHSNGKRMQILVDNLQNSVKENACEFNRLRSLNTANVDGMKLAVNDCDRFECAQKLLTSNFLIKLQNQ